MVEFIGGAIDGQFMFVEKSTKTYIHIWYVNGIKRQNFYVREGDFFKLWRKHANRS